MPDCIIIPARYNSRRIPGKPLIKIDNEYLIVKTLKKIFKYEKKQNVYICTDSKKVKKTLNNITDNVIIVKKNCINGTQRCSYAVDKIKKKFQNFIIVSCDMPFLNGKVLNFLKNKMKKQNKNVAAVTVHTKIKNNKILNNRNVAKIVLSKSNTILFISRSKIPFSRRKTSYFSHHGLVIIKKEVLRNYKKINNSRLQLAEDNEWLKLIENDFILKSYLYSNIKPEINTKKDLLNYFPLRFKT